MGGREMSTMEDDDELAALSSTELVRRALALQDSAPGFFESAHTEDRRYDQTLGELHRRGTKEEFELGVSLLAGSPDEVRLGCNVLSQLGPLEGSEGRSFRFYVETVPQLRPLLSAADADVRAAAAGAFSHLGCSDVLEQLVPLARDESEEVRFSVALALLGRDDDPSVMALIELSSDVDDDVRNWALFGLGAQIDRDDPLVREALFAGRDDPHLEARGEALLGLARRGDARAKAPALALLEEGAPCTIHFEVAETFADKSFLPALYLLRDSVVPDDDDWWVSCLERAIVVCEGGDVQAYDRQQLMGDVATTADDAPATGDE
jgi:hypothetical protein